MIVLKYKGIEVGRPISWRHELSGEFRLILRDINLKPLYDSGWGRNTILNVGLDTISGLNPAGTENPFNYWHVGNSAAAVVDTQIGLQGWIASSTTNIGSDVAGYGGIPDYQFSQTRVHRFGAGTINDTVREVGAGSDSTNNSNFYARHLVNPVVPVGIDQVLDVAYKHTVWPQLGDTIQNGVLTMDGEVYDTITRGANIDKTNYNLAMGSMGKSTAGGSNVRRFYEGDIGDNLNSPSGASTTDLGSESNLTYTLLDHYRDVKIDAGLNDANLAGPIRSLQYEFSSGGLMQVQFDRNPSPSGLGIPKDNTKTMDLTIRESWARRP